MVPGTAAHRLLVFFDFGGLTRSLVESNFFPRFGFYSLTLFPVIMLLPRLGYLFLRLLDFRYQFYFINDRRAGKFFITRTVDLRFFGFMG